MESFGVSPIIGIPAIILLVIANGFFVAAEFALVSVRRTRIAELVARGDVSAERVQEAINNPDQVIAATQLGITLASLALGWVGEPALEQILDPVAHLLQPVVHLLAPVVNIFPPLKAVLDNLTNSLSAILTFSIITFLHVVVGELAPKSIALQDPERTSLFVAGPTLLSERIFKPAIWALNGAGNALLRLVGVEPASGHHLVHSVEELKMLVSASAQSGVVEAQDGEMLQAVFSFGEMLVRQVMIPRTEVIAVEASTPINEIINLVSQSTFTKFPVYEDDLDHIIGIVHVKDLLHVMQSPDCRECTARSIAREPLFLPETASVRGLLQQFRDQRQHIAIVMDEFGGTGGLVTLEDLLEEIFGEISDPFDANVPEFQNLPDGSILIDGLTLIEDVSEQLNLDLQDPDYDTIAGYIMGKLERIPRVNDAVESDGIRWQVTEMDGMRISRIELSYIKPTQISGDEPSSETNNP